MRFFVHIWLYSAMKHILHNFSKLCNGYYNFTLQISLFMWWKNIILVIQAQASNAQVGGLGGNGASYVQSSFSSYSNNGQGPPKVYQATTSTKTGPGGVSKPLMIYIYLNVLSLASHFFSLHRLVRLHDQSSSNDEVGGLLQVLQTPI